MKNEKLHGVVPWKPLCLPDGFPYAKELKVTHPQMLKAITASKKKNDAADAEKIADLLRCNLLPECYMAPEEHRKMQR